MLLHNDNGGIAVLNKLQEDIKKLRKYYYYDKNVIREASKSYNSINELRDNMEMGNFHISIDSVRFDCFVRGKKGTKPEKLYVIYTGGRPDLEVDPYFVRWSYYPLIESLDSMILCISDPMFQKYEDLFLGWYYGTEDEFYVTLSLEIVRAVCDSVGMDYKNVIFFGSSGGGYASIYAASLMKGALSVSINPQIYLEAYSYAKKFEQITGVDLKKPDELHRNSLVEIIKSSESKHCIMVNVQSADDMENQLLPLTEELGMSIRYGLSSKDNVLVWIYDCSGLPEAHKSQETRSVFYAIDYVVNEFKSGTNSMDMQKFVLFANECWHDVFEHKVIIERLKQEFIWLGEHDSLNEVDYERCIENHQIKATTSSYNFWKYDIDVKNAYYCVTISDVVADSQEYTVGIYDFKNSRKLHFENHKTDEKVQMSFVVGNIENVALCIYSGLHGQTNGLSMTIGKINIKRKKM